MKCKRSTYSNLHSLKKAKYIKQMNEWLALFSCYSTVTKTLNIHIYFVHKVGMYKLGSMYKDLTYGNDIGGSEGSNKQPHGY